MLQKGQALHLKRVLELHQASRLFIWLYRKFQGTWTQMPDQRIALLLSHLNLIPARMAQRFAFDLLLDTQIVGDRIKPQRGLYRS